MHFRCFIFVLALTAGCSQNTPNPTASESSLSASPWSDGPGNGSVSSIQGDQLSLTARKCDFYSVVHHICNRYEVNCVVRPASLVDREISLEIGGNDAATTFTELADVAGLECVQKTEVLWSLSLPGSDDAKEELIRMSDF